MRSLMTPIVAAVATMAFWAPDTASASHDSPLYRAACNYRDAVRDFERAVIRSPYQDRYAERVADQLEDASSRFRSAARHPEDLDRLLARWHPIQLLQPHVESVIFANPRCPSRLDLLACWERVTCAYSELATQLAPFCARPIAPPVIPRAAPYYDDDTCPLPGVAVRSYRTPSYPIPQYGVPSYGVPNYRVPSYGVPNFGAPSPVVPERVAPIPVEPQPKVPLTHPSHWRERGYGQPRSEVNPPWNAGHSHPSSGRVSPASARNTSPIYSYKGIDVGQIGALISRLVD